MHTKSTRDRTRTSILFANEKSVHAGKKEKYNTLGVQQAAILLWIEHLQQRTRKIPIDPPVDFFHIDDGAAH